MTAQPEMIAMTHLMNQQMDHRRMDHHLFANFLTTAIELKRYHIMLLGKIFLSALVGQQ